MPSLLLVRPRAFGRFVFLKRYASTFTISRDSFRYEPLDVETNEIRLLTVLPFRPNAPGVLHCSLKHQLLEPRLEYHGLSYAWKDSNLDEHDEGEEIVVNESRMVVGRNLAAALRARQLHGFSSIPLWVDALCINQDDIAERNAQILRMRNIYAQASLVTIWLGPERDNSARALNFISRMSQASRELEGWVKDASSEIWAKDSSLFLRYLKDRLLSRQDSLDWLALHKLLQRAWWKRMWIVQETVAARRIVFLCGLEILDPQDLSRFLDVLSKCAVMYMPLLFDIEGIVLDYDTFSLTRAYLQPITWNKISLLQALYRTGMSLSTDARDKVFAVLNLAYDGAKIVPNPDYTMSAREVYKQLVVSLVKETGRLDVLSLANLPVYPRKLDISIPSWVPDWTFRVTSTVNSRVAAVRPTWADLGHRAVLKFSDNNKLLTARGFIVDTIDGLAMYSGGVERPSPNSQLHQSKSRESRYTGIEAIEAICQSLLANRPPTTTQLELAAPETRIPELLSLFLQQSRSLSKEIISAFQTSDSEAPTFKNWYRKNQGLIVAGRTVKEWVNDLSLTGLGCISVSATAGMFDFFDFNRASPPHSWSWRLFTTKSGYVGIGPNTCQPGDKVVVIFGCASPLVLHPLNSHYQLVGECYVHGIMHGETVQDPSRRECEIAVDFEIR
ncbi:hypothetical protein N431DRAFT_405034 [Stipitochalara longipes BDJ]|nr:hypothetical protein N431DRAFT_405034 [Stipitochalara longipes BDJ]